MGGLYAHIKKDLTFRDPGFWKYVLYGELIGGGIGFTASYILAKMGALAIFASGWTKAIIGIQLFGYKIMLHGAHHGKGLHFVVEKLTNGEWKKIIEKIIYR